MAAYRQRCAECERTRSTVEHISATRMAGGNYRRPPRQFSSTICVPCAQDLVSREADGLVGAGRWDQWSVKRALDQHLYGTCRAQTYGYRNGVQVGASCYRPATTATEALDGSQTKMCDEHAQMAIDAGARLVP